MMPDEKQVIGKSKKIDTLVARMMEACEKEGASLQEVRWALTRLQCVAGCRIEEIETGIAFTAPPQKEN